MKHQLCKYCSGVHVTMWVFSYLDKSDSDNMYSTIQIVTCRTQGQGGAIADMIRVTKRCEGFLGV